MTVGPLQAAVAVEAVPASVGLFGSVEFRAPDLTAIPQWTAVLDRIDRERAFYAACAAATADCDDPRVLAWQAKIDSLRGQSPHDQLRDLNAFINGIMPYRLDQETFGASDYWASPAEFLRSAGDCEDYAIIKFVSLLELGFTNDQLRIVVVKDTLRDLAHAILAVDLDGETYILDSLFDVVPTHAIVTQYDPQYSVNLTDRWAHIVTADLQQRFRTR